MITKRDASIATFLRSVPVFLDLKGSSLEILFEFLEERRWDVGEHICNEGEMGRTLYVIREGEVEVLRRSATGNNQSIVKLGPGECFGEMAYLSVSNHARGASVTAATESRILRIRVEDLERASADCRGSFDRAFISILIERLNLANTRLTSA
jgi:eukaryotic-like serine/threonine-protein kinase